jgi:hypothetical protein
MFKRVLLLCGLWLGCEFAQAQGEDIYTTGVQSGFAGNPTPNIIAWTQPNFGGQGAFVQMSVDSNLILRPTGYSAGIPGYWFIVPAGTVLDPVHLSGLPRFSQFQMSLNVPFYMGFFLDAPPYTFEDPMGEFGSNDRFGWAKLEPIPFGPHNLGFKDLSLLDSAIADQGLGIITGTTTVAPEPASFALLALGGFGLITAARRSASPRMQGIR